MDKDKIEMKTVMESAAVAEYLTQLAKGFKSGSITVEKDGESLTLVPAETAEVEVEARMKKDKARFSLEVTWRTACAQDEPASLKISAEAPVAEAPKAEDKGCCAKAAKPEEKIVAKTEIKTETKTEIKKEEQKPAAPATPAGAASKPADPKAAQK